MEGVHELTFIGVNALNLDIENGIGVESDALMFFNELGEGGFTDKFNFVEFLLNLAIVDGFVKEVELFGVSMPNAGTDSPVDKVGEFGVIAHEPAAMSDTVSFIIEHAGPILVEVVKGGRFKDVGVDTSDAVYGVGADDSESCHMNFAVFDNGHGAEFFDVIGVASLDVF